MLLRKESPPRHDATPRDNASRFLFSTDVTPTMLARGRDPVFDRKTREKRHHDAPRRPTARESRLTHCACAPLSNSTIVDERKRARSRLYSLRVKQSIDRTLACTILASDIRAVKSELKNRLRFFCTERMIY